MSPLSILEAARHQTLVDSDRNGVALERFPGMSPDEIEEFAQTLPCPLPSDIRELLVVCKGVEGPMQKIDFTGSDGAFEMLDIFPHGLPIAGDGFGNFWVVDLVPSSSTWGPIYYASHDPPTVAFQSADLSEFLTEVLRLYTPPNESLIEEVHEDRIAKIWRTNPGVVDLATARASEDPVLGGFGQELEGEWFLIDLRSAKPGDGFSWGRFGPQTVIRRAGEAPIFAYQRPTKRGWLARLLGG
jgi:hypothetical protein